MAAAGCRIRRRKDFMKRIIALATVLLVGLASVQAAQTDDQQKKKKKKQAQTTSQTTPAPKTSGTQTTKNRGGTQTSNQQVVKKSYVKPGHSNAGAAAKYNQQNVQVTKKYKNKNQNYVVTNNNAQW